MDSAHPLDCTVWSSLNGRHNRFAFSRGRARRYNPSYGVFAAVRDRSRTSLVNLGALVAAYGDVALLEDNPPEQIPGVEVVSQDLGFQMVAMRISPGPTPGFQIVPLGSDERLDMLGLTALTKPGPFFELTHQLGDFFGVKVDGQLVAMAGERMKPDGFTEVSGVCTHPDFRGHGFASALMRLVSQRILDRGETPFLHAYASNRGAIALYEDLGFSLRREILMTRLSERNEP